MAMKPWTLGGLGEDLTASMILMLKTHTAARKLVERLEELHARGGAAEDIEFKKHAQRTRNELETIETELTRLLGDLRTRVDAGSENGAGSHVHIHLHLSPALAGSVERAEA